MWGTWARARVAGEALRIYIYSGLAEAAGAVGLDYDGTSDLLRLLSLQTAAITGGLRTRFQTLIAGPWGPAITRSTDQAKPQPLDNLPPKLERTYRQQWQESSLQTEVPAEGILELTIQCICVSLNPYKYTPRK
ncbi:hypothetical protein V8E54_008989 [Elaphomyces granulatus]